ncbi:type II secretion system protein [Aliivibrio salmonicida]|uniref:type II secretion system protein n=1 Tax=Aliivibrio salmonicida TaxID=40269 RepID=UPI00406CB52A
MVGLLITLSFLSYAFVLYSEKAQKERIKSDTQSFYNRLLFLKQQIHAFNADQYQNGRHINSAELFPATLQNLEGVYVPPCLPADNAQGFCFLIDQTPWGKINYEREPLVTPTGTNTWRAVMRFTLPDQSDPAFTTELSMSISMLTQIPTNEYDPALNQMTIYVNRPDMAFAYDGLVKRSGDDSTLLGDWDVGGNHAITNAKDYTIKNSDGSQKLISRGLSNVFTLEHGDTVEKPSCPNGLEPSINLALGYIKVEGNYQLVGSQKPYLIEAGTNDSQWQVGLALRVKNLTTNKFNELNSGEILAITQCK